MVKTGRLRRPAAGTRLPLSATERFFASDPEFILDGVAEKIRLITAQDGRLGPVTAADFASLLPLEDVVRWHSEEIQFPNGNWRSGVIVEFGAKMSSPDASPPAREEAATTLVPLDEAVPIVYAEIGYPTRATGGWRPVHAKLERLTGMQIVPDKKDALPDGRSTVSGATVQRKFKKLRDKSV
jgi:hypothetical protein